MPNQQNLLKNQAYQQRLLVEKLRSEVFQHTEPSMDLMDELDRAEITLAELEEQIANQHDSTQSLILSTGQSGPMLVLGAQTTGLNAEVNLRMAQVPTAIYHLLDTNDYPLLSCTVTNHDDQNSANPCHFVR